MSRVPIGPSTEPGKTALNPRQALAKARKEAEALQEATIRARITGRPIHIDARPNPNAEPVEESQAGLVPPGRVPNQRQWQRDDELTQAPDQAHTQEQQEHFRIQHGVGPGWASQQPIQQYPQHSVASQPWSLDAYGRFLPYETTFAHPYQVPMAFPPSSYYADVMGYVRPRAAPLSPLARSPSAHADGNAELPSAQGRRRSVEHDGGSLPPPLPHLTPLRAAPRPRPRSTAPRDALDSSTDPLVDMHRHVSTLPLAEQSSANANFTAAPASAPFEAGTVTDVASPYVTSQYQPTGHGPHMSPMRGLGPGPVEPLLSPIAPMMQLSQYPRAQMHAGGSAFTYGHDIVDHHHTTRSHRPRDDRARSPEADRSRHARHVGHGRSTHGKRVTDSTGHTARRRGGRRASRSSDESRDRSRSRSRSRGRDRGRDWGAGKAKHGHRARSRSRSVSDSESGSETAKLGPPSLLLQNSAASQIQRWYRWQRSRQRYRQSRMMVSLLDGPFGTMLVESIVADFVMAEFLPHLLLSILTATGEDEYATFPADELAEHAVASHLVQEVCEEVAADVVREVMEELVNRHLAQHRRVGTTGPRAVLGVVSTDIIAEAIEEMLPSIVQEVIRALVSDYIREKREMEFLQSLLQPLVLEVVHESLEECATETVTEQYLDEVSLEETQGVVEECIEEERKELRKNKQQTDELLFEQLSFQVLGETLVQFMAWKVATRNDDAAVDQEVSGIIQRFIVSAALERHAQIERLYAETTQNTATVKLHESYTAEIVADELVQLVSQQSLEHLNALHVAETAQFDLLMGTDNSYLFEARRPNQDEKEFTDAAEDVARRATPAPAPGPASAGASAGAGNPSAATASTVLSVSSSPGESTKRSPTDAPHGLFAARDLR